MAKRAKRSPVSVKASIEDSTSTEKTLSGDYPRHAVDKCLRIPKAILEQNAGKPCTVEQSAKFLGVGSKGPFAVEVSSGLKFGFLRRPSKGQIVLTDRAKQILKPQNAQDILQGYRDAVQQAPTIADVYGHYRGENLPDDHFFQNALTETFKIPVEKVVEFKEIFLNSLRAAQLIIEDENRIRVVDVTHESAGHKGPSPTLTKLERDVQVEATDSCFVVMPFGPPLGGYYEKIYKPAIEKAGLIPFRADNEIFGTGKIIDQIYSGINAARVLVAELTTRNPNVFYELGLAHALEKPVVLVSSNEEDVPFDLRHIRVIYYDVTDPFWGNKLLDKVAENILSAIEKPGEAVLKRPLDG